MFHYYIILYILFLDVEFFHGVNVTSLQTNCLSSPVILLTVILSLFVLNCSFKLG